MSKYELGIVGSGNMAQAIARGVIDAGLVPAGRIVASDVQADQRQRMADLGAGAVEDNAVPAACPRVLLAVKPQVMKAVVEGLAPGVAGDAAVISIAAGITTSSLDRWLGGRGRIIRVMPNTPMLVGEGMSALAKGPRATESEMLWAQKLFASCGRTVVVSEEQLDAVTAVSGSGPAYLFYLVEAMVAAGVAEGLPEATARALAAQTCLGASRLLIESGESPQTLRARVTSPNGTTQKAIETMASAGMKPALVKAIRAAAARSRELGNPVVSVPGRTQQAENDHDRLEHWKEQFDLIKKEAHQLVVDHHIFVEVKKLIFSNPVARQASSFHSWLDRLYTSSAVIGIRRLLGKKSDEITFKRLLDDIKLHHQLFTIERHICFWTAQYGDNDHSIEDGKYDFELLCGAGNICLQASDVEQDAMEFMQATTLIQGFATSRIAHSLDKAPATLPTYGGLEEAHKCLEKLVNKYGRLLSGCEVERLLPVWQYDWKAIFRVAWLPPEGEEK